MTTNHAPCWTPEMEARLRDLLVNPEHGFPPFTRIAAMLTAESDVLLTGNSIAGKVNRMGLCGMRADAMVACGVVRVQQFRRKVALPPLPPPPPPPPPALKAACTLFELQYNSCRWPIGEDLFCGHERTGRAYCDDHTKLAYARSSR
jgi:hypothetical protein